VQSDARKISRVALSRRLQQLWQLPVPVSGSEDTAAAAYYYIRLQYNIISVRRPRGKEIRVIQLLCIHDEIHHGGHDISMDNSAVQDA